MTVIGYVDGVHVSGVVVVAFCVVVTMRVDVMT